MRDRTARTPRQDPPDDVGTLWKMQRDDRTSRCALMAWPTCWELRVLVDDLTLLSERCVRADEAFALAERWKHRMLEQGWRQIVPRSAPRAQESSIAPQETSN
jgi:hypothetical protein